MKMEVLQYFLAGNITGNNIRVKNGGRGFFLHFHQQLLHRASRKPFSPENLFQLVKNSIPFFRPIHADTANNAHCLAFHPNHKHVKSGQGINSLRICSNEQGAGIAV